MTDTIFKPGEYMTRDGRKARVYATDGGVPWTLHGAIFDDGEWTVNTWQADGVSSWSAQTSLMPPKQVRYVNVYKDEVEGAWSCRSDADRSAARPRLACIRIEFEEGQYDD